MTKNKSHAKQIEAYFGHQVAAEVKVDTLRAYVLQCQEEGLANATIVRRLAILKRAFTLAYEAERLDRVPKFPTLRIQNVRQGTYSLADIEALCVELPEHLIPVVKFGYLTGRRRGEILAIKWEDVDLKRRILTIRQGTTKTGTPDRLPLEGELYELMLDVWETANPRCPFVFHHKGQPIGPFQEAFKQAAVRAGLPDRIFHDLRRTMVTDSINAGNDVWTTMAMSGHKSTATAQRYNITGDQQKVAGMSKLAAFRRYEAGFDSAEPVETP